jgi:hypothetical protein
MVTGCGAIVFAEMINAVQWVAIGSADLPLYILPHLAWYYVLFLPALGGLLVALIVLLAHEERGHGVPEVMESVALKSGKLRPQGAIIMALTSALTIGTGGSVGREGPIVHIGASLGSLLGQILRVAPSRLPILTGCGVAGGIAAVFNAPIAGAFFALEVIMGNFAMPAFGPVMLSSVVAADTGVLQGIVSYRDLLQLYNREILHQEYLGLDLRTKGRAAVREDVQLPHNYIVTIFRVPEWCVGSSLSTLQLRTRFGLTVVAIRKGGIQRRDELPDPNDVLTAHDYLVVVGRTESIHAFRNSVHMSLDEPLSRASS